MIEVDTGLKAAAESIYSGTLNGRIDLASLPSLSDLDSGLRVQLAVLEHWLSAGESLGGWKVGMSSGSARDRMGVGYRPFGYVLEGRVFSSGCELDLAAMGHAGVEAELAFLIGKPLRGPDVSSEQVDDAIAAVMPAFEILQPRIVGARPDAVALADDMSQWGIVLGAPRKWNSTAAAAAVDVRRDGQLIASVGPGFSIDEPLESLGALCALLDEHGLGLEPGQRVVTGAFFKADVDGPCEWTASFAGLGDVAVRFTR